MNRISSLFSFVGNWLKNVPKYLAIGKSNNTTLQEQWQWQAKSINPTTGAETSSSYTLSCSNHLNVPAAGKIVIVGDGVYDFSVRCYNSSGTYLTPTPTVGFVTDRTIIDAATLPTGTSYLRLVIKRHDDAVIPTPYTIPNIAFNVSVSSNADNDYAVALIPGNGLKFSVDPDVSVPNVRIDTYAAAVTNRFFPEIAYNLTLRGVTGYVTGGRKYLFITIPMCFDDRVTSIDITALRLYLRHWDGFIGGDGYACQSLVTAKEILFNQNVLRLTLTDDQLRWCSTNNVSCAGDIGINFVLH